MKKGIILAGVLLPMAMAYSSVAQSTDDRLYRDQEFSVDLFGGGTLNEHDVNHLSGERIRHHGRAGLGAGGNFFFLRYLGISGEVYSENPDYHFIDEASGNLVLRIPIGETGLAPYGFGGGGHQFDPFSDTFGQAGAGLEFRFTRNFGIFADGRWVWTEHYADHGMGRAGFRLAF